MTGIDYDRGVKRTLVTAWVVVTFAVVVSRESLWHKSIWVALWGALLFLLFWVFRGFFRRDRPPLPGTAAAREIEEEKRKDQQ